MFSARKNAFALCLFVAFGFVVFLVPTFGGQRTRMVLADDELARISGGGSHWQCYPDSQCSGTNSTCSEGVSCAGMSDGSFCANVYQYNYYAEYCKNGGTNEYCNPSSTNIKVACYDIYKCSCSSGVCGNLVFSSTYCITSPLQVECYQQNCGTL
jgi:hypothetical protein